MLITNLPGTLQSPQVIIAYLQQKLAKSAFQSGDNFNSYFYDCTIIQFYFNKSSFLLD
jgi:hypothetical protein